jgi:hypothetical protein
MINVVELHRQLADLREANRRLEERVEVLERIVAALCPDKADDQ